MDRFEEFQSIITAKAKNSGAENDDFVEQDLPVLRNRRSGNSKDNGAKLEIDPVCAFSKDFIWECSLLVRLT